MARNSNINNSHQPSQEKGPGDWKINDFIGVSPQALEVREQLEWLASDHMANCVLITGESGTGKDLSADILQSTSVCAKDKRKMVHVDGGTLHSENIQSQLFGHCKGSYTGCTESRLGCFRAGEHGTVFLNEIGNIPYNLQAMLLRVVEYRIVSPMGGDDEVKVDHMMIFATNRDLEQMCEEERFMPDLLKRMQRYQMHIPPLRERKEDIPLLTDFLYRKICLKSQSGIQPKIEKGVYGLLSCCELKGNVRELENKLIAAFGLMRRKKEVILMTHHFCCFNEKTTHSSNADVLTRECLNEYFMLQLEVLFNQQQQKIDGNKSKYHDLIFDLKEHYQCIIIKFLQLTGGNKTKAAKNLGISPHNYDLF